MKFILVNGRKPRLQLFCAACCEPIRDGYVRSIGTRLTYCDCHCYGDATVPAIRSFARVS
jgi:hypothetical protein